MKKLTAGILASLIGLVSANSAEAAVASTEYVKGAIGTKQDTLTDSNFKVGANQTGEYVTGFTVNNGVVEFTKGTPEKAAVDAALDQASTNAIQNQAVAKKIAEMASSTVETNKVVKSVTQDQGKITPVYGQVTGADIAAETIESANIKDGTIATADIADSAVTSAKIVDGTIENVDIKDVHMDKVTGLAAALNAKQATLTNAANAGNGISIDDTTGKISAEVTTTVLNTELAKKQDNIKWGTNITVAADGTVSATDTTYTTGTATAEGLTKLYGETGSAENGTMTQKAITEELEKKQVDLKAGNGITLDEAGNIAAKAGTGITIDTNGISADNQLDAVNTSTAEGVAGAQVLTRAFNSQSQKWEYTWENVDREYSAQ